MTKNRQCILRKDFKKRMLIPKIFFISVACILGVTTLQEIVINNNFLKKDIFFIIFTIYWVVGLLFCIVYIPIASYAHIVILFKNLMVNHLRLMPII